MTEGVQEVECPRLNNGAGAPAALEGKRAGTSAETWSLSPGWRELGGRVLRMAGGEWSKDPLHWG